MNIVLWIVQVLLALSFFIHGRMMWSPPKSTQPGMEYMQDLPSGFRRFIGVAEILAVVGLILPAATGFLPWLTPLAAAGLIIIMAGAVIFHIRRKEYRNLGLNLILLAMAIFIAFGRFVLNPL